MTHAHQPIRFYNRHSQQEETERVYGEAYLRWAYGTALGKLTLWAIVRRAWFSHIYGWRMQRKASKARILPFIETYGLEPSEFAEPVENFGCFNDFFIRRLKGTARPIDANAAAVFPADGRHSAYTDLCPNNLFGIKGESLTLTDYLGNEGDALGLSGGVGILSRLCPVDYHRFHVPVKARLVEARKLKGPLDSVSPIATRLDPQILLRNQRVVFVFESETLGRFYIVAIGAACVGTVKISAHVGDTLEKGAELGWFEFGGSSLFTLFPIVPVALAADLLEANKNGMELYAKMGTLMAQSNSPKA